MALLTLPAATRCRLLASLLPIALAVALVGLFTLTPQAGWRSFFWSGPVKDAASNPRQTIFDELSPAETRAVAKYVVKMMPGLKTTFVPHIGIGMMLGAVTGNMDEIMAAMRANGDYLTGTTAVTLMLPDKAAALAFLDGTSDERPARYAKVVIMRGTALDVMEYRVGPIHGCDANACDDAFVEEDSPLVPLTEPGAIPYEKRPMDLADVSYATIITDALLPIKELLIASFGPVFNDMVFPLCGGACYSGKDGTAFPTGLNDISSTSTNRVHKVNMQWYRDDEGSQGVFLHVLPLQFKVALRGQDPNDWRVYDFMYCGSGPYANAKALLEADPPRCTFKPDVQTTGRKGDWDIPGAPDGAPNLRSLPPPPPAAASVGYSLSGASGGNGRLVEWQGWSFFVTLRPSTGLAAMDVRFKGKRVAYELALNEATAHYSGSGGDQSFYLDAGVSMTQMAGDLKRGVDCPAHASYLSGTIWVGVTSLLGTPALDSDTTRARAFDGACIFEDTGATSHWRHFDLLTQKAGGLPSSTLVVRAVAAVGNYDYITEYRFGLEGSIRVNFEFAGYMEVRWFSQAVNAWERSLGEVVRENVAAPLHSHFGCFKVDLEGAGGAGESLEKTTVGARVRDDLPEHRYATKYVLREYPESELAYKPDEMGMKTFAIVDKPAAAPPLDDATPSAKPGYQIRLGPTVGQVLPDDHPFVLASAFSKYGLAVTRRKEAEDRPTSVYDLFAPAEPHVSLDDFLDGESIVQQDLVAWVTVGKEHLPRTEDLPLISNFGTYFDLLPQNMHRLNAAMDVKGEL